MLNICKIFKHKLSFKKLSFLPDGKYYFIIVCNTCDKLDITITQSDKKMIKVLKKIFKINTKIAETIIKNKTYSENWGIEYTFDFINSFIEIGIPLGYWNMFYYRREYRNNKK